MEWSPESKLKYLLGLSWTVTAEQDPDEGYTILRVAELPSAIATGDENDIPALTKDFWESLQATLESALEFGDPIPLPNGAIAPWDLAFTRRSATPTPIRTVVLKGNGEPYFPDSKTSSPVPVSQATKELAVA
jgi:hypothetical protein